MNKTQSKKLAATLKHLGGILGILQNPIEEFLQAMVIVQDETISKEDIENFIAERNQARVDKNWQRADDIRQTLLAQGIELEDSKY